MTTSSEAIERIAVAIGESSLKVRRAATLLKEADTCLWPEADADGRIDASHVTVRHLFNLVVALAIADPITTAPEIVRIFAGMKLYFPDRAANEEFREAIESIELATLCEAFETLIDASSDEPDTELTAFILELERGSLIPFSARIKLVRLYWGEHRSPERAADVADAGTYMAAGPDGQLLFNPAEKHGTKLEYVVRILPPLIKVVAELTALQRSRRDKP